MEGVLVGKMGGTSGEEGRGRVCKKEAGLVGREEGQREKGGRKGLVGKMRGASGEEGRGRVCKKETGLVGREEGQREKGGRKGLVGKIRWTGRWREC